MTRYKTTGRSGKSGTSPKTIHHACMHNLDLFLQGEITFAEWKRRQEELESRLSPEPELPFTEEDEGGTPGRPKAA